MDVTPRPMEQRPLTTEQTSSRSSALSILCTVSSNRRPSYCRHKNSSCQSEALGPPDPRSSASIGGETNTEARIRNDAGFALHAPGNVLLSHKVAPAVPSALEGLAALFGMGRGVSPPPWPPEAKRFHWSGISPQADARVHSREKEEDAELLVTDPICSQEEAKPSAD